MTASNSSPGYSNPFEPQLEKESINVKRYLSLFISNWYWFAISLFISISIAYGVNRWSDKVYTVSSTLLIKDDQNSLTPNLFPGSNGFKNQQNLKNEIGILKSFNLNYQVIKKLPEFYIDYIMVGRRGIAESRMYKNCPFIVVYDSLERQMIGKKVEIKILSDKNYNLKINGSKNFEKKMSFGQRFNEMGYDFTINLRNKGEFRYSTGSSNKYYFYFLNPVTLANSFRSKLSISPIEEDASLVKLSTSGYVLEQEVDYLNKLMDVYLVFGLEYKNKTSDQSISFIESLLLSTSDSLKIAEGDLERFKLDNRLINIPGRVMPFRKN